MATHTWLLVLACGLPMMLAMSTSHHACDSPINGTELGTIMYRIAGPYMEMKNERNHQLDELFVNTLEMFRPLKTHLNELKDSVLSMGEVHSELMPEFVRSIQSLSQTAVGLWAAVNSCNPQPLGMGLDMATLLSSLNDLSLRNHVDMLHGAGDGAEDVGVFHTAEASPLSQRLTCDRECQSDATGVANRGKLVSIEDVTAVLSVLLDTQIEQHRQRYLGFTSRAQRAKQDVMRATAGLQMLVTQLNMFGSNTEEMQRKAVRLLDEVSTKGKQLAQQLVC